MTAFEVVLDGATEPVGPHPTSLERAATPTLDELALRGEVSWRRTIPRGLPVGTETAMPVLLGWTPTAPVARGALEAAARDLPVPAGRRAHRLDGPGIGDLRALRDAGFTLHDLTRRRALVPGHGASVRGGLEPPRTVLAIGAGPLPALGSDVRIWADGLVPPPVLDARTVVVAAVGAAAGVARLLGADVIVPDGATGDTDSDLRAKARAALAAADRPGVTRVVVHVGAPDAAAHRRDAEAKVCAIEAADRHVLAPLLAAVAARPGRASLAAGADHGCDPATGRHHGAPVPWVRWAS
ncbi:hypothetical protein GKE82_15980 [Conexibacter sp. W3-3-2]|uniref:hypothetical protein n=1 Tax=Conexibacter sp. W3-3-2 TaxID=2675227 RepID=UPI0012B71CDF|nr:hypothetical protein [Conexibacter sp. W3-3-2]MTD45746.1 hypothetical protein [Conexibacter sp. W3-3-2]